MKWSDTMKNVIIKYDINYEEYLRKEFPNDRKIVEDILKNKLKHILYSQIGRDAEKNGKVFHVIDRYKIYDVESKKNLHIDDQRIDCTLKDFMRICENHYLYINEEKLFKYGISYKIYEEFSKQPKR